MALSEKPAMIKKFGRAGLVGLVGNVLPMWPAVAVRIFSVLVATARRNYLKNVDS